VQPGLLKELNSSTLRSVSSDELGKVSVGIEIAHAWRERGE